MSASVHKLPRSASAIALAFACVVSSAEVVAQKWVKQSVSSLGIEMRVPDTLAVSPLDPEESERQIVHLKYKFSSEGVQSYEGSTLPKDGSVRVLVFPRKLDKTQEKDRRYSRSFEDFVRNNQMFKGDRTFHRSGDRAKAKGKTPDHKVWEYSELMELVEGKDMVTQYHVAATYLMPESEIAVVFDFWDLDNKPDKKLIKTGLKIAESLIPTAVVDAKSSFGKDPRAKFADTPAKVKALEAAVARVQDLEGWDFLTTERFIVLYSHAGGSKQKKAIKVATGLAKSLAMLRAKFEEDWPLADGQEPSYPVLRVCHTRDIYSSFGQPGEPVGRFVPESGEAVIFNDAGGELTDKNGVRQLMVAAAWQQYAAELWPGAPLQRWWLYGTSDYYAQFEPKGKKLRLKTITSQYVYFELDEGRFRLENPMTLAKADLRGDEAPALSDFVQWEDSKFDGARPANNRALAYTLIDFLARGPEKLGDKMGDAASKIWREYPVVMAKTKSTTKTISKVFAGVDYDALQTAWKAWAKKNM